MKISFCKIYLFVSAALIYLVQYLRKIHLSKNCKLHRLVSLNSVQIFNVVCFNLKIQSNEILNQKIHLFNDTHTMHFY